jgi:hypothetical protein
VADPISIGGLPVADAADLTDGDYVPLYDGDDPSGATTKAARLGDIIDRIEVGASPATTAAAVTVNTSGLVVVEGVNVQAALASIDQALASGGGGGVGPGGTVDALAIETTDLAPFRVKSPQDAWDLFEINATPLQSGNPNASVFYFRSPQFPVTTVVGALIRVDDYQGAPILQVMNEGGLWVNDNITMAPFYDSGYHRGISMEYLQGSDNVAPALIFGEVANHASVPTVLWRGTTVTPQANKGRWIRLNDSNQLEVSGGVVPAAPDTFGLGTPSNRWSAISATVHEGAEILFPSTVVVRSQSTLLNGGNPNGQGLSGAVGTKVFSQNGGTYTKRLNGDDNSWILDGHRDDLQGLPDRERLPLVHRPRWLDAHRAGRPHRPVRIVGGPPSRGELVDRVRWRDPAAGPAPPGVEDDPLHVGRSR